MISVGLYVPVVKDSNIKILSRMRRDCEAHLSIGNVVNKGRIAKA